MAAPEILSCTFHEQEPLPAPRRTSDNLPAHIKGIIQWYPDAQPITGYYIPRKYSPSGEYEPIEFINNQWYGLFKHKETSTTHLCTQANAAIPIVNCLGIGYWDITEPQHPNFDFNNQAPINIDPPEDHDSTRSNSPTTQTLAVNPTHYNTPSPGLTITSTSAATQTTHIPQITITAPIQQATMSASATGTRGRGGGGGGGGGGGAPAAAATLPAPSNRGMRGRLPAIFNGTCTLADEFWAQFRRYKMVNRTHDSMTKAYDRVLTALTYIRGPMVNDWVNTQENNLVTRTDTTQPNHVCEDDEVLWTEFKTAFNDAWTDTSKKQNAYDQLMKLTMAGWDINTYIATFKRLALTAGWALNAKGTIVQLEKD